MRGLIILALALVAVSCGSESMKNEQTMGVEIKQGDVVASVNLTVAEGKKVIAEGIANDANVQAKLKKGMIIITRGTTNTYIAERLASLSAPHGAFMTGHIIPVGAAKVAEGVDKVSELVLVDGAVVDMTYEDALKAMQPGDIIFKGANLLNYNKNQAAICIGAPDGGTTARLRPFVGENKGDFIIPIGLEKDCSYDLNTIESAMENKGAELNNVPKVWVHTDGRLFTEIEAIKSFANVEVFPYAKGGIAGREGGVTLLIVGPYNEVDKALTAIAAIQGEKPFVE